ncbi:hypothetical protein [Halosegnis longus]|uniref:hypothetical protein n=1 Tax=Halosegnis longus TaxID=2216012 RepID=UPI00129D52E7|nr:hypothetical protein [Halosegnis longus]
MARFQLLTESSVQEGSWLSEATEHDVSLICLGGNVNIEETQREIDKLDSNVTTYFPAVILDEDDPQYLQYSGPMSIVSFSEIPDTESPYSQAPLFAGDTDELENLIKYNITTYQDVPRTEQMAPNGIQLSNLQTNAHGDTFGKIQEIATQIDASAAKLGETSLENATYYLAEIGYQSGGQGTQISVSLDHMPYFTREDSEYKNSEKKHKIEFHTGGEKTVYPHDGMCRINLPSEVDTENLNGKILVVRYDANEKFRLTVADPDHFLIQDLQECAESAGNDYESNSERMMWWL